MAREDPCMAHIPSRRLKLGWLDTSTSARYFEHIDYSPRGPLERCPGRGPCAWTCHQGSYGALDESKTPTWVDRSRRPRHWPS